MSTLLKVLLGLLIALPMTAYVVGSLAASSRDRPSGLDPVVITEAPVSPGAPAPTPTRSPGPSPTEDDVRVLTPQPTQLDDDLDDGLDDGPDGPDQGDDGGDRDDQPRDGEGEDSDED